MKKFSFPLVLSFTAHLCFAQEKQNEKEYKWGGGLSINTIETVSLFDSYTFSSSLSDGNNTDKSYSVGGILSYGFKENFNVRIKAGIININVSDNGYDSVPASSITYKKLSVTQQRFFVKPGFYCSLKQKNILFYGGIEMPIYVYKNLIVRADYDTYTNNALTRKDRNTETLEGGSAFGLGGFAGFDFFPIKRLSFGIEFSTALLRYNLGGEDKLDASSYDANNNLIYDKITTKPYSVKTIKVIAPIGSINLLIHF